jgi:drug/metabolite transporter (DMT)-like permease
MVLLWSGNYVVGKLVLREIPPLMLVCLRTVISGLLVTPVVWYRLKHTDKRPPWRDLGIVLLLGFFGITMNQFCFVIGLGQTTVTHSAIIMSTIPIFVLLTGAVFGMERITGPKVAGMSIAILGIMVLQRFRPEAHSASRPTVLGDFFVLLCAVLLAGMTAFARRLWRGDAMAIVAVGYISGAIAFTPVLFWQAHTFDLRTVTPATWAGVLYMAGCCSVICYLIYNYALHHIAASRVAATQYMQPFLATMLAVLILGERLTAPVVAAGGMIIGGVLVTERFE